MATKTKPVEEVVVQEAPRPALTPEVLQAATHRLKTIEERLLAQAGNVRAQLKDSAPTLEEQIERTLTFVGQSHPGYEMRQLVGQSEHLFILLLGFTEALEQTRALREEAQTLLTQTKVQLAALRDDDLTQMEHREQMDRVTAPLRYAIMSVGMLVDSVAPLLPVARAATGRAIQAAGIVARQQLVTTMTANINRARVMLTNARTSNGEVERLEALVVRAEKMLDVSLPLPALIWPDNKDPFAVPRLETT